MNTHALSMPMKMRHQEQIQRIGITVLGVIAVAGFVAAAAVMPGMAAIGAFLPKQPKWRQREHADRALKRLIRKGLVEEVIRGRVIGYQLTDRGREHIARCELSAMEISIPKRWDGKWRLVVFDIREKQRYLRDCLRIHLTRLGLYPLQQSVWLYPYSCQDVVRLLKVDLGIGRRVQYFTVRSFEDREEEKSWRLHFDV